jgi:hypothetical protein
MKKWTIGGMEMNWELSARTLIAETKKNFFIKYSWTDPKDLLMYLDEGFLTLCELKNGHDDIPHSLTCFGCQVRMGNYATGDSELPPFVVMIEHRGMPDRFVIGGV